VVLDNLEADYEEPKSLSCHCDAFKSTAFLLTHTYSGYPIDQATQADDREGIQLGNSRKSTWNISRLAYKLLKLGNKKQAQWELIS